MELIANKISKGFAVLISLLLIGCTDSNSDSPSDSKIVLEWKADSLGCDHIRTLEMAVEIAMQEDLLNKSYSNVCAVLGSPNEKSISGDRTTAKYYFQSTCYKGEIVGDICWVLFEFENDKLKNLPEIGTCQ